MIFRLLAVVLTLFCLQGGTDIKQVLAKRSRNGWDFPKIRVTFADEKINRWKRFPSGSDSFSLLHYVDVLLKQDSGLFNPFRPNLQTVETQLTPQKFAGFSTVTLMNPMVQYKG